MPELPEVETIATQLNKVIVGKTLQSIEVLKEKSWSGDQKRVLNHKITQVNRKAKILRIHFDNKENFLIHLKMSGQLIFTDGDKRVGGGHPTADWIQKLPSKHTRIIFTFTDKTVLYFNDQRIFGWVRLTSDEEVEKLFGELSPDIIDPVVNSEYLFEKAQSRNVPIKLFIMDNQIISGVGNIYANDALNLARISPLRKASSLTKKEMTELYKAMLIVIELGIKLGGATSDEKYVHVTGMSGHYQDKIRVYQKTGEPCPNCGEKIIKTKIGGRGTFYCSNCQK